jgi:hypothetical protein
VAPFDIRAWRAERGLPERIDNPEVVESVTRLLARDLSERLATAEEQRQSTQDRTVRRSANDAQRADSATA